MRNLLAGLSALLILLGTLGWFRSWYSIGSLPADPGCFAFRVEFDGSKVGGDVMDSLHYVHSKLSSAKKDKEVTSAE